MPLLHQGSSMSKGRAAFEALAKLNTSFGSDKRRREDMIDTESQK